MIVKLVEVNNTNGSYKLNEVYYVNKKFLFIDKKYKIVEIN